MTEVERPRPRTETEAFAAGLRPFLAECLGVDDVTLRGVRRYIEGFSWETWAVTMRWRVDGAERTREVVVRREPVAGLVGPYDVRPQWELGLALRDVAGVPVPEPLWVDLEGAATGRPLYVMARVEGDVPAPWNAHAYFASEAERTAVGQRLMAIGAAIHDVSLDRLPAGLRGMDAADPAAEVAYWEGVYERDRGDRVPALERAFGWLAAHTELVTGRRVLVHGDFRIGNFILREGEIAAMLDWELTHVGDPVEDLANCALRLYRGRLKIPSGLLPLPDLLAAYGEAAGWEVPLEALRFWLVFNDVRAAVGFITATRLFDDGRTRDLRYAAFGRQLPHLLRHLLADLSEDADA